MLSYNLNTWFGEWSSMYFWQKISERHKACSFDRFATLVSPCGKTTLRRIHPVVVSVEGLYRTHRRNRGMISTVPVLSNTTCTALPFYSGNYSPRTEPSNTVLQAVLFSNARRHLYRPDACWLSIQLDLSSTKLRTAAKLNFRSAFVRIRTSRGSRRVL